jgi:hypothetical protein
MQPGTEACPICRRLDGGHDQAMHDMADKGGKAYPAPKKVAQ